MLATLTPPPTRPAPPPLRVVERRVSVALPPPHSPAQRELVYTHDSLALLAGARFGKTEGEIRRAIRCMIQRPGLYWWVGLSWKSSSMDKAWQALYGYWHRALLAADLDPRQWINRGSGSQEIRTPAGARLMLRTAESPASIAGDGPLGVIGDEFTYWDEEVWTRFVQPSLADHQAWCHLIGRPNGSNWGTDLWEACGAWDGWSQRRYTIYDNPTLSLAFIDSLKPPRTPAPIWAQEYMAEPESGGGGGIPRADVLAAMERWRGMDAAERKAGNPAVVGIDVSEGGGDATTLAMRYGWTVAEVIDATPQRQGDMMPIADRAVLAMAGRAGAYAIVDAIGVGAMLASAIGRAGGRAAGYKGSKATAMRDTTGQFGFVNVRAAAWWHLRELLGETGPGLALPDDRALLAELTAPRFEVRAGARIGLEDKEAVKRRLGRSPDRADSVVMCFWDRQIMRGRNG